MNSTQDQEAKEEDSAAWRKNKNREEECNTNITIILLSVNTSI